MCVFRAGALDEKRELNFKASKSACATNVLVQLLVSILTVLQYHN